MRPRTPRLKALRGLGVDSKTARHASETVGDFCALLDKLGVPRALYPELCVTRRPWETRGTPEYWVRRDKLTALGYSPRSARRGARDDARYHRMVAKGGPKYHRMVAKGGPKQ